MCSSRASEVLALLAAAAADQGQAGPSSEKWPHSRGESHPGAPPVYVLLHYLYRAIEPVCRCSSSASACPRGVPP